ncbi:MAG: hypothetical protein IKP51_09120 [Treponema sp.]|nr:hypothetical protein [Treponema sp.]
MNLKRSARLVAPLFFMILFFSCASTPSSSAGSGKDNASSKQESEGEEEIVTNIPLPNNSYRSYFYSIDQKILGYVENGSPDSLQQASSLIYKNSKGTLSDKEIVLMNICQQIMQTAWPSRKVTWEVPSSQTDNPYSRILQSAANGIYDSTTERTDFLTTLLPSMVIFSKADVQAYYAKAKRDLNTALAMRPDSVLANYLMSVLEINKGNTETAATYLTKAEKGASSCVELKAVEAAIQYNMGNYARALSQGELLLASSPQNSLLLKICATAALKTGNVDKAENYVLRVLQNEPENTNFTLYRADILMSKNDYIKASSLLDAVAKTDSTSKLYLIERTRLLREWNKNNSAASQTIAQALQKYPEDVDVLLCAASVASESSSPIAGKSAMELANKVLAKLPDNIQAQQIIISEHYKAGRYQEAYQMCSKLIKEDNVSKETFFAYIDICIALKNNSQAMDTASKLYSAYPEDEDVLRSYINMLVATGKREQAQKLINTKLETSSGKMKSFLYYQRSLLATGEDEIFADLRASLTANPRNKDALYRFYRIYYNKQDWRRAQYYLKQVVAIDPRNSEFLAQNAELDALLGR